MAEGLRPAAHLSPVARAYALHSYGLHRCGLYSYGLDGCVLWQLRSSELVIALWSAPSAIGSLTEHRGNVNSAI